MDKRVFSDFELDQWGIKPEGAEATTVVECVGSCEEEMNTRIITKKCRGVVKKKKVKPTGDGKYKITVHMPWAVYTELFGMNVDGLVEGVKAYGTNSTHKNFSSTMHITDEDGVEKYKAYPNCVIETGLARKIENGAEEVAEVELEVSVMPDEYGNGLYEALADELKDENIADTWMTAFTPEMVQVTA
ncbi:MAG: phage tail protein [Clostridia bacterium]|nr:phage tail protein [Clostridia bacterium]